MRGPSKLISDDFEAPQSIDTGIWKQQTSIGARPQPEGHIAPQYDAGWSMTNNCGTSAHVMLNDSKNALLWEAMEFGEHSKVCKTSAMQRIACLRSHIFHLNGWHLRCLRHVLQLRILPLWIPSSTLISPLHKLHPIESNPCNRNLSVRYVWCAYIAYPHLSMLLYVIPDLGVCLCCVRKRARNRK